MNNANTISETTASKMISMQLRNGNITQEEAEEIKNRLGIQEERMARKTLRQKLEENGKLESAMSYADIRTPDNSLKERVASRANSIMNNSENKISSFAPIIRTGNTVSQKNTMDVIKYKREEKTQKEQKEKQERIDKFKQMNVEQAKKANETMKNGNILET